MNTYYWLAIVLLAYARPIDLYWRYTEKVNGRIVKEHDYVKRIFLVAALAVAAIGFLT